MEQYETVKTLVEKVQLVLHFNRYVFSPTPFSVCPPADLS